MEQEKMGFSKAIISAIIILAVALGVMAILTVEQLPVWLVFMLFTCFALFTDFNFTKLPAVIGGALVGITLGFAPNLLKLAFSLITQKAELISTIIFLILVVALLANLVAKKLPLFVNPTTMVTFTLGLVPGLFDLKFLVPYYGEYIGFSIILVIISFIVKAMASKKAKTEIHA